MTKPRVLMLPKWYPHRYDDQDGDFVARHVAAIAPHVQAAVVFAAVARGPLPTLIDAEADLRGPVPTWRYYYRQRITGVAPLDAVLKLVLYYYCLGCGYRSVVRHWRGRGPQVVHVHVLLRTGLFAWWLWRWHRIPYLITEHWTLYLPVRAGNMHRWRRWLTRRVVREGAALHTVSTTLQHAMETLRITHPRTVVIANVVDTELFRPKPERERATLLHVAAFQEAVKNLIGVLRVVAQLRRQFPALRLRIAGYGPDEALVRQQAANLGLLADGTVEFLGKLPHTAVAAEMQRATALVSFSRAETFGCVFMEARACGCPVVASRTVPELFQPEGTYGLLVPVADEAALAAALTQVLQGTEVFSSAALRADAVARCSPGQVGQAFANLYSTVLPKLSAA